MRSRACILCLLACLIAAVPCAAQVGEVEKLPDEVRAAQIRDMKFGMFICWSLSTFSGYEWTRGVTDPAFFRATGCDTDQWCQTAKDAGMNYILFLTKHHDGFCLWDTKTTDWKVTNAPLGIDVLAKLRASCDAHGLKLALYFSEGDWTWIKEPIPEDGLVPGSTRWGDPVWCSGENAELKKAQLKELCTEYGPIEFFWMDHAQGTGGLSHAETTEWVNQFQPNCFVGYNHGEPSGRLSLRERGRPGPIGDSAASEYNKEGEASYKGYLAAEFTYPIVPEHHGGADWFYSLPEHDHLVHPPEKIYRDYLGAVQYGNIFSLDVGPNYEGRIRDADVQTLRQVGEWIRTGYQLPGLPPAADDVSGKADAVLNQTTGIAVESEQGDEPSGEGASPEDDSMWSVIVLVSAIGATVAATLVMIVMFVYKSTADYWEAVDDDLLSLPITAWHAGDEKAARTVTITAALLGGGATAVMGALFVLSFLGVMPADAQPGRYKGSHPLLLAGVTAVCIFRGVRMKQAVRRLTITSSEVTVSSCEGRGWTEPLANYSGLLGKTEARSSGETDYSVFVLELVHPDRRKAIRLLEEGGSFDQGPFRELWKSCARVLNVPALQEDQGGVAAREVEDLDKTPGELVREGKLDAQFDTQAPVPESIDVCTEGSETVVTIRPCEHLETATVKLMGIGLGLFVGVVAMGASETLAGRCLGVLAGGALVAVAARYRPRNTRLRITRGTMEVTTVARAGERFEKRFDLFAIEEIRLKQVAAPLPNSRDKGEEDGEEEPSQTVASRFRVVTGGTAVLDIVTRDGTFEIPARNTRMRPQTAEWLRAFLLNLLAAQ